MLKPLHFAPESTESADDDDLIHLYKGTMALVQTSIAEGFGLPLIEAALHGAPQILADLPVFREICAEHAVYFEPLNSQALAACLKARLSGEAVAPNFPIVTWSESTRRLASLIREDARPASSNLSSIWTSF